MFVEKHLECSDEWNHNPGDVEQSHFKGFGSWCGTKELFKENHSHIGDDRACPYKADLTDPFAASDETEKSQSIERTL